MEIKNLAALAVKIKDSMAVGQKIILFADADLDGVASLIILEESIKCLGFKTAVVYFPDREEEGYGLNYLALQALAPEAPALLITLDCGISNFEEIKQAKSLGFEVAVVDHHQILDRLPEDALLIVDPNQPDDAYPFKKLANVGIVYFLSQLLLGNRLSEAVNQGFLELAALATLADMMEEQEDNKPIVEQGLDFLFSSSRPGIRALLGLCNRVEFNQRQVAQKMISLLNITVLNSHLPESYTLLTSFDEKESQILAEKLLQESRERQSLITAITAEIGEIIKESSSLFIFEGSQEWPQVLTGAVASRLCNKSQKPAFIFKIGKKLSRGSLRTPKGIDGVQALGACCGFLETYGGHTQAAGFCFLNENQEKFRDCLINYFKNLSEKI